MIVILSVPDDSYSRNASCGLNLMSTFLLAKKNNVFFAFEKMWTPLQYISHEHNCIVYSCIQFKFKIIYWIKHSQVQVHHNHSIA